MGRTKLLRDMYDETKGRIKLERDMPKKCQGRWSSYTNGRNDNQESEIFLTHWAAWKERLVRSCHLQLVPEPPPNALRPDTWYLLFQEKDRCPTSCHVGGQFFWFGRRLEILMPCLKSIKLAVYVNRMRLVSTWIYFLKPKTMALWVCCISLGSWLCASWLFSIAQAAKFMDH